MVQDVNWCRGSAPRRGEIKGCGVCEVWERLNASTAYDRDPNGI